MLARRCILLLILVVSYLGVVACGQSIESAASARVSASETSQYQNSSKGTVVDVKPTSALEPSAYPPGQTLPGAGAAEGASQTAPAESDEPSQSGKNVVYTDNTYKFRVSHPVDFVVRNQPTDELAQFAPKPTASIRFMKPVLASSDLGNIEAADLNIHVYPIGQGASLETWLTTNGLVPADGNGVKPFETDHVSGVEVCASTLIGPGCSYYVLGSELVYQLTPASQEGEAMIKTFVLVS